MEKFKMAMGFPMLAAVVWLFNIATSTYGKNVFWLGIFLVSIAATAWTFGEFVQRGRQRQPLGLAACALLLLAGYAGALEKELNWRHPMIAIKPDGSLQESADGIAWQPWSSEAVAQARATGHPVLVDFTADWCLTCQVNKKTSLEIASVREKIKSLKVVALLADYTHTPDAITTELSHYHRAGVPLVLIYPADASAPPIILPEVLTPSLMLEALDHAGK
jgi:thiol:disulfide interchange protein DsbD